jgi:hypothetical protein
VPAEYTCIAFLEYASDGDFMLRQLTFCLSVLLLFCASVLPQSLSDFRALTSARSLDLSSDGNRLWYQVGQKWWVVDTKAGSHSRRGR